VGFKNSLEWQIGSVKSEAIAYLTHGSFLKGQRERYLTVYPFANMILNGRLADNPFFSSFQKNEVFIFCNFRPKGDCRPDLLAFSSKGDVFLVEGKQRRQDNEASALENLRSGIKELEDYFHLLSEFSRESRRAPYEHWLSVYNDCYVKNPKHGFPELGKFVSKSLSNGCSDDIHDLFKKITDNISQRNILFGLAFNDPDDNESYFPLDSFDLMPETVIKYIPNPKEGIRKYGYSRIESGKICRVMRQRWDSRLGKLFVFGVDRQLDSFRILDKIG